MSGKANGTVKVSTPAPASAADWAEYEVAIAARDSAKATYLQSEARVLALRERIAGAVSTALVSNNKLTEESKPVADPVVTVGDAPVKTRTSEEGEDRLKRIKAVLQEVHFRTREPLNEIMKLFVKRGEPMTRSDVANTLKLNPKTASQRLARAVELGLVKHDGRNNYGLA